MYPRSTTYAMSSPAAVVSFTSRWVAIRRTANIRAREKTA
jgi:hypothetical protein